MQQRLISMVLVPFFVVGNSFAHAHCATAHSCPSHGRAHFHIGSGSHHAHPHHGTSDDCQDDHDHNPGHDHDHDHNHETHDSEPTSAPPVDHDSDAHFVMADNFLLTTAQNSLVEFCSHAFFTFVEDDLTVFRTSIWRELQRFSLVSGPPLYLLHAALRL